MINENISKKYSQFKKILYYDICKKHEKTLYKICITCKIDICSQCEKDHVNHYIIKQEEIMPDSEEIKKVKFGIENFIDDYNQLFDNIKIWQKEINEKILFFENENKNNIILHSIDFIKNYNTNKMSLNNIIKFRKLYSCIIGLEIKNNKILSFLNEDNFYNKQNNILEYNKNDINFEHNDYLAIKYLLKDINKYQDNFINRSKKVMEYLYNFQNKYQNVYINKSLEKTEINDFHLNNQDIGNKSYIIKKLNNNKINNIKARDIQKDINKISIENKLHKSYDNFSVLKKHKNTISVKDNESTYSLSNISNGSVHNSIYSKKNYLSKNNNLYENELKHNTKNINDDKNYRYHSLKNINLKNNQKSSNDNNDKLNNSKSMINIQQINDIIKKKTYVHKKFILKKDNKYNANKIIHDKLNNYENEQTISNKLSISQNNLFSSAENKKSKNKSPFNNNLNKSENKNNNIIDIPISFTKNKKNNNIISSLFINPFQMDNNKAINSTEIKIKNNKHNYNSQTITNQIFINPNNKLINKVLDLNIIKPLKYEFIKINNDKNIYIGIDLGNNETKIGVLKNYNEIQIMNFSENNYSLPTMISFNNKNNEIIIGSKAEESLINNPSQTIFNIVKIFGHDYDEIINNNNQSHLLWPFKLYKDKHNKPHIKIKIKNEEKNYYFDEILIFFLKKLFDLLFQKISIDNINKNENNRPINLNMSLIVSIPNYFTFCQRKMLEKIFISDIFPKKCSFYGGYQINLVKIGIENRTNMAGLCLKNNLKFKNNNALIINLDTSSVDVSIISIYNNIIKVISIDSIELINENFTDNFINLCLKILKTNNINIPKEFLYSDSLLSKIRKLSSIVMKNLEIKEESIFIIDNLNNGNGNCIIKVNRIDYEKICYELCKKIIILIKNILMKSQLNENDINDILLLGEGINMNKLNQMIKELFINNKKINEKLSNSQKQRVNLNDENKDFSIVIGSVLIAYSLNNPYSSYNFKNVCSIDLGIESYNGNMDLIIRKNIDLPINIKKNIKIKNSYNDMFIINIYEGENILANKNKLISQLIFDKREFKFIESNKKEYLELSAEFQIDNFLNTTFYLNDIKTNKHLFNCEINIQKQEK